MDKTDQPFTDPFKASIAAGDLDAVRKHFDSSFGLEPYRRPRAQWEHLYIALLLENRAMMKLLILWGAEATAGDMEDLQRLDPEKYEERKTALRLCGMKIPPPTPEYYETEVFIPYHEFSEFGEYEIQSRKREPRTVAIFSFVDGQFVDSRLADLPQEARALLRSLQEKIPDSFIAGSGLCDAFNKKSVQRLDYYLPLKNISKLKNIKKAFEKAGFEKPNLQTPQKSSIPVQRRRQWLFGSYIDTVHFDIDTYRLTSVFNGIDINLNLIDLSKHKSRDLENLQSDIQAKLYEAGMDQISSNGHTVSMTYFAEDRMKNKTIPKTLNDQARLEEIHRKYPDWTITY